MRFLSLLSPCPPGNPPARNRSLFLIFVLLLQLTVSLPLASQSRDRVKATTKPTTPSPGPPKTNESERVEIEFWQSIRESSDPADFEAYLHKYPRGKFAILAKNGLARLRPPGNSEPQPPDPASAPPPPLYRGKSGSGGTLAKSSSSVAVLPKQAPGKVTAASGVPEASEDVLQIKPSGNPIVGEIKIAHLHDMTGVLNAFGNQSYSGFMFGLYYATDGTMQVNGKRLTVIEKDTQGLPEVGRSQLEIAFQVDHADLAVGPTNSWVALAMLPVAQEQKKLLLIEAGVADAITGESWNRYIFRTDCNTSQEAISNALALDQPGVSIGALSQDYALGREYLKVFKGALKRARVVHEEYLPVTTTDVTAGAQRIIEALKGRPGRKVMVINWAGMGNPQRLYALNPQSYGVEISTGGSLLPILSTYKDWPGIEGSTSYHSEIAKNKINDWLVSEYSRRFRRVPSFYDAAGMSSGLALVEALKRTGGSADTETLISTMEGMGFD